MQRSASTVPDLGEVEAGLLEPRSSKLIGHCSEISSQKQTNKKKASQMVKDGINQED